MEEVAAAATTGGKVWNRTLSRKTSSSSFRLRTSPSLNTLRLRRIFDIFDKNGDGVITVQELYQALSLLSLDADLPELESIVTLYVEPGNVGLTFEGFVRLHQSLDDMLFGCQEDIMEESESTSATVDAKMSQEESDLSEAFKVFDEDGDGFISARELQVVLGKLGLPEGNEFARVQQMIVSVDRNHDGRVDFFEFKNMMQSVLVRSS